MRCTRCQQNTPLLFKIGTWGIPYQECTVCNKEFYSEIAGVLDRGSNPEAKSVDEYLDAVANHKGIIAVERKPLFLTYSSLKASTYNTISMETGGW